MKIVVYYHKKKKNSTSTNNKVSLICLQRMIATCREHYVLFSSHIIYLFMCIRSNYTQDRINIIVPNLQLNQWNLFLKLIITTI